MKRVARFELEDGSPVFVEVEAAEPSGLRKAGGAGAKTEDVALMGRFESALSQIRPAAEAVVETLKDINTPAEISLEFSLKFSFEVKAFLLASTDAESNIKVGLKWKNEG